MTSSQPSLQNAVRKLDELAARCPGFAALQEVPLAELGVALDGLQAAVLEARQALADAQASATDDAASAGVPPPGPDATWSGLRAWLRERVDQPMRVRVRVVASLLERLVPTLRNAGLRERAAKDLARFTAALGGSGDGLAAALADAEPYEDMQRLSLMRPEDPGYDDLAEKCFFAWKPGRYALLLEALTSSSEEAPQAVAEASPEPLVESEPAVVEAPSETAPESEPEPEPAVADASPETEPTTASEPVLDTEPEAADDSEAAAGPDADAATEGSAEPVAEKPWPELEEKPAATPPIMDPAARQAPEDPFTRIMVSIPDKRYFSGKPAARDPKAEPPADRTMQDFLNWDGN